jgi:hypothetical protein
MYLRDHLYKYIFSIQQQYLCEKVMIIDSHDLLMMVL